MCKARRRGGAGVHRPLRRPQRLPVAALELTQAELKAAFDAIPQAQRAMPCKPPPACAATTKRRKSPGESWSYRDEDGTLLGQKVTPLDPRGHLCARRQGGVPVQRVDERHPGPCGGVGEIIMVVPTKGEKNALVLAAAYVAGVTRAFTIGGAQAVAALAYGTETVPKVDKITGPGNAYVASAKKRVFGTVGIDMIAGPSEILVLADGTTPPDWVAMDLSARPSTTNWPSPSCCAPTPPTSTPCSAKSTACCPPCRAPKSSPRAFPAGVR